jgi:hypothetical protein
MRLSGLAAGLAFAFGFGFFELLPFPLGMRFLSFIKAQLALFRSENHFLSPPLKGLIFEAYRP